MTRNNYNTIIVGAGIAGLTAAVYLARDGQRVLLVEKNRECGGLVSSFDHNGFHFDAGLRAIEDAGIIFPLLKDLEIELEVVKSPVSLGIEDEIIHINNFDNIEDYKNLLLRLYPGSGQEIDDFIKLVKKIMKHMEVLYGIENPAFKDLKQDRKFLFQKLLPWLPKFLLTVGKINRMNTPVEDYLETIIKNPSLRDIISQHFFKNTPTFFALSYFSLYLDYFYPLGGTGKLVDVVQNKLIEFGGEIKNNTKIVEVNSAIKSIKDDKGNVYNYENLVWAADLKTLYEIIDTDEVDTKLKSNFKETKNNILNNRGGDSVFTLFVEVNEPLESFKKIANGHFFYTPSKKGLGKVHTDGLNSLLDNWEKIDKDQVLTWLDKFIQLNTFEISIPGLKDPNLVPTGKTGIIISFLAEYDLFKKTQLSGWYDEFIAEIEKRLLKLMSNTIYPMLKDKVISAFAFTPISIENRVGSSEGAITGWSFEKPVPVINKIQYSDRSVLTPIPFVYQAGQWAYSPAGVPMSILTGKLAADKIIKKNKSR